MPKILVVEDNEITQHLLSERLSQRGYQILVAGDGAEGVTRACSEKPDLIIMDMSLPVLDGPQAVEQLRELHETRAIPIIALTAHVLIWDREKCVAAGCNEYEIKPIDFYRLLAKIQALLENASPN